MSKTNFKIDISKISYDLKKSNPSFVKKDLNAICGISNVTIASWEKESPDVVELLYSLCQSFDFDFNDMIMASSELFPVVKLLKYYRNETKKDLVEILIITE